MSGIVLSASARQNLLSLCRRPRIFVAPLRTVFRPVKGQHRRSTTRPTSSPRHFPRQPRQRHQQPAGWHRQRHPGAAGRQHRSDLAAAARRQRQVSRQSGLQAVVGYSAKSTIATAAIAGATANDLRGTAAAATDATKVLLGAVLNRLTTAVNITGATLLTGGTNTDSVLATAGLTTSASITVNGTTISFTTAVAPAPRTPLRPSRCFAAEARC